MVGVICSKLAFLPIFILFSWPCVIYWRQCLVKEGSFGIHCSQSGKDSQRTELGCGHVCICIDCICALLHKAATCRTYLLEFATAGNEVWTWTRRGLFCATGWHSDLQPAEDIGRCSIVALVCLRLCYLGNGLFNSFLDLQDIYRLTSLGGHQCVLL